MPQEQEHQQKAQENEELADSLEGDGDYQDADDWVLTMLFYTALHNVERKLAESNMHSGNHNERKHNIKTEIDHRSLWQDYKELKDWSEQARYDCMDIKYKHLTYRKDDLEMVKSYLGY
ncbi:MAG: hypothetical protein V5A31_10090 [Haloferacaceae archaeon]